MVELVTDSKRQPGPRQRQGSKIQSSPRRATDAARKTSPNPGAANDNTRIAVKKAPVKLDRVPEDLNQHQSGQVGERKRRLSCPVIVEGENDKKALLRVRASPHPKAR